MRIAILIALAAWGWGAARADDALIHVTIDSKPGYIVPESYAMADKADLIATMPGVAKLDGFWTPPEQDVAVADRAFMELIHAAAKDPSVLFPELAPNPDTTAAPDEGKAKEVEQERSELTLISENYASYARQYVGIIINGQKLVLCNYSEGTKVDPAKEYIFIQKTFATENTHFLQCRFEPLLKNVTNVSIIGSWQAAEK